jgi:hypothetical protein
MPCSTFVPSFITAFTVSFSNPEIIPFITMPRRVTHSRFRISDAAFRKQVTATEEALKTFNAIVDLNAPGPTRIAMEELISITVRLVLFRIYPFENTLIFRIFP